jgi:hypothetical protein
MFGSTYVMLWGVVLLQGFILVVLARQMVILRGQVAPGVPERSPLPLQSRAPEFQALDMRSGRRVQSVELHGMRTVLCFLSADCHTCRSVAAGFSHIPLQSTHGLVVYCTATAERCRTLLAAAPATLPVLMRDDADVAELFQLSGFPTAVVLDEQWRVAAFRSITGVEELLAELSDPRSSQAAALLEAV